MGRVLRRVPLTFYWPLNKRWKGFSNPHYSGHCRDCATCGATGLSLEAKALQDQWYGNAPFDPASTGSVPFEPTHPRIVAMAQRQCLNDPWYYGSSVEDIARNAIRLADHYNSHWGSHLDADDVAALLTEGRLMDFTRNGISNPTPQQVNEWSIDGFGHDSTNCWIVVRAKAKRLGVPYRCAECKGDGQRWDSRENKKRAERWKERQPPTGAGYQVWETVSEGSPISPVFKTPIGLKNWLVRKGYSPEAAHAFIGIGWTPTMMQLDNHIYKDIEACAMKSATR